MQPNKPSDHTNYLLQKNKDNIEIDVEQSNMSSYTNLSKTPTQLDDQILPNISTKILSSSEMRSSNIIPPLEFARFLAEPMSSPTPISVQKSTEFIPRRKTEISMIPKIIENFNKLGRFEIPSTPSQSSPSFSYQQKKSARHNSPEISPIWTISEIKPHHVQPTSHTITINFTNNFRCPIFLEQTFLHKTLHEIHEQLLHFRRLFHHIHQFRRVIITIKFTHSQL
jgi:hypothetical protein